MNSLTSSYKNHHLSVPIQFAVDAQQKGYMKKLRLFLLLKLMYPSGKTRLEKKALWFIELVEQIRTRRTTYSYLNFLFEKGWLVYNAKTGYYILKSFDRIRNENQWEVRWAIPVHFGNYFKLKAITGAIIYGYLHKDFCRKLRKKKSALIKGGAYHFRPSGSSPELQSAPVSVYGAAKIFGVSPSTASRLKQAAEKEIFLEVKKNFGEIVTNKKAMQRCLKYNDKRENIVYHEGEFRFQLIDSIFPLFLFVRRKKLKP